ncbi:MAG: DNA-directed DNA polymerase I [archaeon]
MATKLDDFALKPAGQLELERKSSDSQEALTPGVPSNLSNSYLLSVDYDGDRAVAYVKLYEPTEQKIHFWFDNTGHKPYCFADQPLASVKQNQSITRHLGFEGLEPVSKLDLLEGTERQMTKIIVKDPLSIGGRPSGCIRDLIKCWEADIRYVQNYVYDKDLKPGMIYRLAKGNLLLAEEPSSDAERAVDSLMKDESPEFRELALEWTRLLEAPVPDLRRAALDIEVHSPIPTRLPDPSKAEHPVICTSILGSDGIFRVLLLRRTGLGEEIKSIGDAIVEYYDDEKGLLAAVFKSMLDYPAIVTFNGDDFDLRYLSNRAQRLGFANPEIPIKLGRDAASLTGGVHIDLYRFFFNRSIQVYAFGQKYRENTLDAVGTALVDMGKFDFDATVSEMTYEELARYCLRDSEIVLRLTSFDDNLVMKLLFALSRISFLGIEDVSRQGVSGWIRSMLYRAHRRRGYLIPRPDDILERKGVTATEAIIKGKKYKGAVVIEPVPGVHFNVAVLDFMSMYPSVIKRWNLGYETILCNHEECKQNKIPGTPHWVCGSTKSLESLVIGSLRDLRVRYYKPKSRQSDLPEHVRGWYRVISDALKVTLNASYGVFGNENFALYCPPVAEATAAIGRYAIQQTVDKAVSLGLSVFYGDTDSLFLGTPTQEKLKELFDWSRSTLGMDLEIDKNYRYLALSSRKKNYLGVYPDGTVDVKGLTGKKRHIPEFLKKTFFEMIDILGEVESPSEFDKAKERIQGIVKESYLKLRRHEYSLEDLAFAMMLSKDPSHYTKTTPQHVKAANQLEANGIEVKSGDLIAFVKTKGEPGVKPIQLKPTWQEIDVAKYQEYLQSTFEQVLDALGLEYEELSGAKKLDTFFMQ